MLIRNKSNKSLQVVANVDTRPGDKLELTAAEWAKYKSTPAGAWYAESCFEILKDEEVPAAAGDTELKDAILMLDAADDAHWTSKGLPMVEVVEEFYGEEVSRADIEAAIPNYNRRVAEVR